MLVSLLFSLWVHEDLREIDRFERPLLIKAERAGDHEQAESIRLVFGTQREKLTDERRAWLWVIAGGAAATGVGPVTNYLAANVSRRRPGQKRSARSD